MNAPMPVSTDDLRKQVNELGALARALFEAQFARCDGGRMPADPTWDDLEPSERDEFWEQARNARHVFGPRSVPVPGGQLREEIAEALWLIEQPRIPFEQAHPQSQAICRSEADAVLSVVAPLLTKANAGAAPAVDRSTLQHQVAAALEAARNRGYRHPDEADTGDLVDAVMGPVDEWDDALHDDLKDEAARLRTELATAREELAKANEADRVWDPASETYCSAADVMKELIQLRQMYVDTACRAVELQRAAQPGTVTLPLTEAQTGRIADYMFQDRTNWIHDDLNEMFAEWAAESSAPVSSPEPEGPNTTPGEHVPDFDLTDTVTNRGVTSCSCGWEWDNEVTEADGDILWKNHLTTPAEEAQN